MKLKNIRNILSLLSLVFLLGACGGQEDAGFVATDNLQPDLNPGGAHQPSPVTVQYVIDLSQSLTSFSNVPPGDYVAVVNKIGENHYHDQPAVFTIMPSPVVMVPGSLPLGSPSPNPAFMSGIALPNQEWIGFYVDSTPKWQGIPITVLNARYVCKTETIVDEQKLQVRFKAEFSPNLSANPC